MPRKPWSQLAPGTKARKLAYYKKQGMTPGQVARKYNAGTLGPQSAARGHAKTPEHGLAEALKKPGKYQTYIKKKNTVAGATPQQRASNQNAILDSAYRSMRRLSNYVYYNDDTVSANVYGGTTSESGPVPGMSVAEATWTAHADIEEIRSMASNQYRGNPWWYH